MTPEQQQVAIAEALEWTEIKPQLATTGIRYYRTGKLCGVRKDGSRDHFVPNYPFDLNAMHEAGKVLSRGVGYHQSGGFGLYKTLLAEVCGEQHPIDATASQRAEAFLRTIGKWEECKP